MKPPVQNELIRNIVAGIGDVRRRDPHLASAVSLAASLDSTLHLVHAFSRPNPLLSPRASTAGSHADGLERLRSELRSRLEARAEEAPGKGRIVCHVVPGSAADVILDVALQEGAGLVFVGATRRGKLARTILGTTAQRVLRASPLPVLVHRRPQHGRPRRVLLTTDLSQLSTAVHERGLALVLRLWGSQQLNVRSLFVAGDDLPLPPIGYQFAMRKQAEQQLGAFLEGVRAGELSVQGKVRLGLSVREILADAKEWEADLLVLGSRSRTRPSRLLIGSVAEAVMRKAACDVLLVPAAAVDAAASGDEPLA